MLDAPDDLAEQALTVHCRETMRVGSLSFFLASRFLPRGARAAVLMLYTWCRYCDDAIDRIDVEAPDALRVETLAGLRRETSDAVRQQAASGPVFESLALLTRRHELPEFYLQELLSGMEMDIEGRRYESLSDLGLYCYRVAGVVGLMFAHLVGVASERALARAASLGMAMQLTNIARDVVEDAAMGRVYLPATWLREVGVEPTPEAVSDPANRARIATVTGRLLDAADTHYSVGDQGLLELPAQAALAVAVARHTYAEIGMLVRARGAAAWDKRCVVTLSRKLVMVLRASRQILRQIPARRSTPWRPAPITNLWRYS